MAMGMGFGKTVVLASADAALRHRLRASLTGMRWTVREAGGGAAAMVQMEEGGVEAMLMDSWLPDLEAGEFATQVRMLYPGVDLLRLDGDPVAGVMRSPRRHELLHALREAMEDLPAVLPVAVKNDGAAWDAAPVLVPQGRGLGAREEIAEVRQQGFGFLPVERAEEPTLEELERAAAGSLLGASVESALPLAAEDEAAGRGEQRVGELPKEAGDQAAGGGWTAVVQAEADLSVLIPGMIGRSRPMLELARLIRLVAPRRATVLIEGETGSGKEVVAQALHRLSSRSQKSFAVLNCAAIPETLLEAELFGHTRGAFTGAVTSRTGRIEAAHGGTLFLDEIGEMPLALQAKMLRFLECGELQRVGDNEVVRVDVRVIAATHQNLERRATDGTFRLDLYHRLAVFPVEVPALRERVSHIEELAQFFLAKLGEEAPRKRLSAEALKVLEGHAWPGNVRELGHVLERATILAEERSELGVRDIRLRRAN